MQGLRPSERVYVQAVQVGKKRRAPKQCSRCKQYGHTNPTCPDNPDRKNMNANKRPRKDDANSATVTVSSSSSSSSGPTIDSSCSLLAGLHHPIQLDRGSVQREENDWSKGYNCCKVVGCGRRPSVFCETCEGPLCIDPRGGTTCWAIFHTQQPAPHRKKNEKNGKP